MATLSIRDVRDRLFRRIQLRAARKRRAVTAQRMSLLELEGLGKDVWEKALAGRDASDHVDEERDSWSG